MAFDTKNLRRSGYGAPNPSNKNVPFSYHAYATTDAAAVVEAAGYFNGAAKHFNKGDVIDAVMATGGTPVAKRYVVTSANQAATVAIAVQTVAAG